MVSWLQQTCFCLLCLYLVYIEFSLTKGLSKGWKESEKFGCESVNEAGSVLGVTRNCEMGVRLC